ncbi:MAG: transketolase [Firmicutes bacterium]|nr:transketolase [Bacillota bacterium]
MNKHTTQAINALRILATEAIEEANSGHPGIALGAAPTMYTLWAKHLRHNPKNPNFFDRDRFILSAGHGSALLYSTLHLFGYGLSALELKSFRQLASRTPGHPEHGVTPGVETSTGPLGQGFSNAVGFALAEKMLASKFNKSDAEIVDHHTYVLCGDGDIEEGITSEAASLAGTWGLGKLIVLYDSNNITIEGNTATNFTECVLDKFMAMGWQALRVENGEDIEEIDAAITLAKKQTGKPTIIEIKTQIGFGSSKAGSADSHGAALGKDCLAETKKYFNWTAKPFEVPKEVTEHYNEITAGLVAYENDYIRRAKAYKTAYPTEYEEYMALKNPKAPDLENLESFWQFDKTKKMATRTASEIALNRLADLMPTLVGGSADLGPSNKTILKDKGFHSISNPTGRNIQFGIREHAMAAISNGIALHGGFFSYCATFLVFSDYLKHAVRMSSLMGLNVIYIFSHDSIGVGEDGPTHQPVEQVLSFRSIPGVRVWRPSDGVEVAAAYATAYTKEGPTVIVTSRQDLPPVMRTSKEALKGGYILEHSENETPACILMASGSEISLAVEAKKILKESGIDCRVVSMPCMEVFEKQTAKYKESILPNSVRVRVAVEAGSSLSWHRYVGLDGGLVTMDTFGKSAPAEQLFDIYGFTVNNVVETVKKTIKNYKK